MNSRKKHRKPILIAFLIFLMNHPAAAEQNRMIELTTAEKKWIEENHTVRVRVADWPPFQFNRNGFEGISVDYIEKILSLNGIHYEFVSAAEIPWSQALEYIRNHEVIDMILTAKITDERKEFMIFSDEYLSLPWVIFTRTDSDFISSLDDLKGKTVSVPKGFVMHDLLKRNYPEINLKLVTDDPAVEHCLKMLANGQVDAYIGNLSVGSYIMMNKGLSNLKVAAPTPFGNHDQAMAIRNDWPELAGIINKTLATFTPEDHNQIMNRWMAVRYEHGLGPQDILKWVLAVSVLFSMVLFLSIQWNRRLKREIEARKMAEKQVQASEERYKGLSEAAFEGVLIAEEGYIKDANRAALEMFCYERDELMGKDVIILIHPDEKDRFTRQLYGKQNMYEINTITKTGMKFPVSVRIKRFKKDGKRISIVAVTNLTEIRKADEEIKLLRGFLPICSHCKQIRDDKGYWNSLENYMMEHNIIDFTHSLCPKCAEELYPELELDNKPDSKN